MTSGIDPQVNDDDVEGIGPELAASALSQNVEGYAKYLRELVARIDKDWAEVLRPQLNRLIHIMEREAEVP